MSFNLIYTNFDSTYFTFNQKCFHALSLPRTPVVRSSLDVNGTRGPPHPDEKNEIDDAK